MRTGSVDSLAGVGSVNLTPIVSPSNRRLVLRISIDAGVGYLTCNAGDLPLTGMSVVPAKDMEITWERHGDLVRRAWYGSVSGGPGTFGVMQVESDVPLA